LNVSTDADWIKLGSNTLPISLQPSGEYVGSLSFSYEPMNISKRSGVIIFNDGNSQVELNVAQDLGVSQPYKSSTLNKDHNYIYTIEPQVALSNVAYARSPMM